MTSIIQLKCEECGKDFERSKGEHTRNQKRGRRVFCGKSCQARAFMDNNLPVEKRSTYDISKHSSNKRDELSPFRYHLRNVRMHCKKNGREIDITLQDLSDQWNKQNGICPYTGWILLNPETMARVRKIAKCPNKASLDRIDSSKGYTKDNIQFVSFIANVAKHDFSEDEFLTFCKHVVEHRKL